MYAVIREFKPLFFKVFKSFGYSILIIFPLSQRRACAEKRDSRTCSCCKHFYCYLCSYCRYKSKHFYLSFQIFRFFQELFRLQAQRLLLLQSRVQTKQLPFVSPPFIVIYNKKHPPFYLASAFKLLKIMFFLMFIAGMPNGFDKSCFIAFCSFFWVAFYKIRTVSFNAPSSPVFTSYALFCIS